MSRPIVRAIDKVRKRRDGPLNRSDGDGMNESDIRKRALALRLEHRDLDVAIDALRATGSADQLQLARLKKRKLLLRDEIQQLEDQLSLTSSRKGRQLTPMLPATGRARRKIKHFVTMFAVAASETWGRRKHRGSTAS